MELNESQKLKKKFILQCISKELSTASAAIFLGVKQRTVQQMVLRYKKKGDSSFIHGNTGHPHFSPENIEKKEKIKDIFLNTLVKGKNPYEKISYTFFTQILKDYYNIKASYSWVRKILNDLGYKTPIRHKVKGGKYHPIRKRKEHEGELVQVDGCTHDWFQNNKKTCIHGFIDDATGYPVGLYMTKNECLLGYIEAFRNMAFQRGLPQSLYPDRASVFFVNNNKDKEERHITQFGIMMENLGVDMFPAYSPQAKGRVERFWETIQNRLPQLFVLLGIDTVKEANIFLKEKFPEIYKMWFPVKPSSDESCFVKADIMEDSRILKATYPAKIDGGGIFSLMGYRFFCPEFHNAKVLVNLSEERGLWVTPIDNLKKQGTPKLIETDSSGSMPEVMKDLIERTFLRNAKPKFREVLFDVDDIVYSAIKPVKKNLRV